MEKKRLLVVENFLKNVIVFFLFVLGLYKKILIRVIDMYIYLCL